MVDEIPVESQGGEQKSLTDQEKSFTDQFGGKESASVFSGSQNEGIERGLEQQATVPAVEEDKVIGSTPVSAETSAKTEEEMPAELAKLQESLNSTEGVSPEATPMPAALTEVPAETKEDIITQAEKELTEQKSSAGTEAEQVAEVKSDIEPTAELSVSPELPVNPETPPIEETKAVSPLVETPVSPKTAFEEVQARLVEELKKPGADGKPLTSSGIIRVTRDFYLKELGYSIKRSGLLIENAEILDETGKVFIDEKGKPLKFHSFFVEKTEVLISDFLKKKLGEKLTGKSAEAAVTALENLPKTADEATQKLQGAKIGSSGLVDVNGSPLFSKKSSSSESI